MPDAISAVLPGQTAIPTEYQPEAVNATHARALPPQHVQDRMFTFPDVMRGQLSLEAEAQARDTIARAEAAGFVREPSLDARTYEEYLHEDAEEAREWLAAQE